MDLDPLLPRQLRVHFLLGESFLVQLAIFQYKVDYLLSPQGLRCQLVIILISHNPP